MEKKKDPKTHWSEYKDVPFEYICIRMTAVLEKIIIELQPYIIFGSQPSGHFYTLIPDNIIRGFNLWGKQIVHILQCEITSATLWTLKNMMWLS